MGCDGGLHIAIMKGFISRGWHESQKEYLAF